MLSRTKSFLLTLAGNCYAAIKFTTDRWEVVDGKGLVLTWTGATGVVDITLAKVTTEGLLQSLDIVKGYAGSNTFAWMPDVELASGDYVFQLRDQLNADESPRLAFPIFSARSLQNNVPRVASNDNGDGGIGPSTAAGIGVGSTLGGIFLLVLVAFLVYRGRQNKTKLGDQEAGEQFARKQKQKERGLLGS